MMAIHNHLLNIARQFSHLISFFEVKSGIAIFSVRLVTLAFGLVQSMLLARFMSVNDFATWGSVGLLYALVAGVGAIGLEFFVFTGLGPSQADWQVAITRRYFREAVKIRICSSLLGALLGVICFLLYSGNPSAEIRQPILGLLGVLIFCFSGSLVDFFRNIAQIQGRYHLLAKHYFVFECVFRFIPIASYKNLGLCWFLALNGIVSFVALYHLWVNLGELAGGKKLRGRSVIYKRCLWQGGIGILRFSYMRGDEAICMSFAGNNFFAIFLVAKRLSSLVQTVCDMLITHSWGRVFYGATESPSKQTKRVKGFLIFTLFSVVPVCLIFILGRNFLIQIYTGGKYPEAAIFIPWLATGIAIYFLSIPFMAFLQSKRMFYDVFWLSALHSAVVLITSLMLLQLGRLELLGFTQVAGGIAVLIGAFLRTKKEFVLLK